MPDSPPKIDNAPGLRWKARKYGWQAIWQARHDLVQRGYLVPRMTLWAGSELSEVDRAFISDRCQSLQADMLLWGAGGLQTAGLFDGSLRSLIACYRNDADSPYRKLRYRTKIYYDTLCRRIEHDHEDEQIADIKARTMLRWHEDWTAGGHVAMAHAMVGMARTLFGFGATILEDEQCERLCGVLHKMRFTMAKPRSERLTAEQVIAIRAQAHRMGLHSLALAQAIQFEAMLRQKDVIGEWVPMSEPGMSDVTHRGQKWLRGIRWSEIDDDLILRHTTSKRQKDVEVDLKLAPMVMEEFRRFGGAMPSAGPVIVSELRDLPWVDHEFRRQWRVVAHACGISEAIRNMDSRAGAISEATDAGADLEHVRHAATHSDISMTQRYSRGGAEKTAGVMQKRVAHRNKPGT
jgi:hypothetical protein